MSSKAAVAQRISLPELCCHLVGKQGQVIQIGQVDQLEIHPLHASFDKRSKLVDDFARGAHEGVEVAEFGVDDFPAVVGIWDK